jgi:hypothetical protein
MAADYRVATSRLDAWLAQGGIEQLGVYPSNSRWDTQNGRVVLADNGGVIDLEWVMPGMLKGGYLEVGKYNMDTISEAYEGTCNF